MPPGSFEDGVGQVGRTDTFIAAAKVSNPRRMSAAGILGDPALALRRIASDATAPVSWYVAHIAGCLVGFATRLNIAGLADALRMLQVHLHAHQPPQAFAARVQAELIRLGLADGTGSSHNARALQRP